MTLESIKRYEQVIESLNKKIQLMEVVSKKSHLDAADEANLNWLVYHKYNKNLKERMQFVNSVMDWNKFAEDTLEQKDKKQVSLRNIDNTFTALTKS